MKPRSESHVLRELHIAVERYPSDSKAAEAFGVTRGHLSRVLRGEKPITAKIARGLGYEQQRWYVRYEQRD
jgi:plasmid maintenance system antidote protein VapI